MRFKEFDVVQVVRPISLDRVDTTVGSSYLPQLGEVGAVVSVHSAGPLMTPAYTVECVDGAGCTRWLADFLESELELAYAGGAGVA